jgi:hypothetical protein
MLLGSLGPVYVGFVAERASYAAAYAGIVACFLAVAAVAYRTASIGPASRS